MTTLGGGVTIGDFGVVRETKVVDTPPFAGTSLPSPVRERGATTVLGPGGRFVCVCPCCRRDPGLREKGVKLLGPNVERCVPVRDSGLKEKDVGLGCVLLLRVRRRGNFSVFTPSDIPWVGRRSYVWGPTD